MARNRKGRTGRPRTKIKLRKALKDSLKQKYAQGRGVSRRAIKDEHNWTPYIHSDASFKTYMKQVDRFCDWCVERGYNHLDGDIDVIVASYIDDMKARGLSASTQKTALNSIAKALGRRSIDFDIVQTDRRNPREYTRSRGIKERDKHFSEKNHEDLVTICRCFGYRSQKELQEIRAKDFYEKDGDLYCHVKGKGGKFREAKAYYENEHEKEVVREYLIKHPQGRLFPPSKVSSAADIHDYRAEYAGRVYNAHARDTSTLPRSERYHKQTGEVFDKRALGIASQAIGHGKHRYTDMVNSYSRYCKL